MSQVIGTFLLMILTVFAIMGLAVLLFFTALAVTAFVGAIIGALNY